MPRKPLESEHAPVSLEGTAIPHAPWWSDGHQAERDPWGDAPASRESKPLIDALDVKHPRIHMRSSGAWLVQISGWIEQTSALLRLSEPATYDAGHTRLDWVSCLQGTGRPASRV